MSKCVFPGSFNPFTLGHMHVVDKALLKFDEVIVAVAEETYKADMLPLGIRAEMARKSLANYPGVDVKCFSGMLTDFLATENCFNVVRGCRGKNDAAYEKELEKVYTAMDGRVKLILFPSEMAEISADKVRRAVRDGRSVKTMVAGAIVGDVMKYYQK